MRESKLPNLDLPTILERVMDVLKRDLNCIKIGTIEDFDNETQTASVKITLKRIVSISEQNIKTCRDFPILLEVPCIILSGGSSYIQMPIENGDNCILLFSDEDLEGWLSTNTDVPSSDRRHDLSDAVCLVGLSNITRSIDDFSNDKIKIQFSKDSHVTIDESGTKIKGNLESDGDISGNILSSGNGVSGTSTPTGTITVLNGIVVGIS